MEFEALKEIKGRAQDGTVIKLARGQKFSLDPEMANRLMLQGKIRPVHSDDPWRDLRDMWLRLNSNCNGEDPPIQNSTSINDLRALEQNIDNAILNGRSYSTSLTAYEVLINGRKNRN